MGVYPEVIRQALIIFPLIAFLITVPYIVYNYRKYGSVLGLRIVIVYSFVLYLLCIYFLVILPLPSREEVLAMNGPRAQLLPFRFMADILKEAEIVPGNVKSWFSVFNGAMFQFLFNVLMLAPFGIYMRYYFKCSFRKTLLLSFLLSLFFELTQLSGLYFIYPRGYRLFDVDDLLANTAGGALGYFVIQPFLKILPSREEIDDASYRRGKQVSFLRRVFAFAADAVCIGILFGVAGSLMDYAGFSLPEYFSVFLVLGYFILLTALTKGQTVGKWLTRTRIATLEGNRPSIRQYLFRYGLLYGFLLLLPEAFSHLAGLLSAAGLIGEGLRLLAFALEAVFYLIYFIYGAVQMARRRLLFYEKWSCTKIVSNVPEQTP